MKRAEIGFVVTYLWLYSDNGTARGKRRTHSTILAVRFHSVNHEILGNMQNNDNEYSNMQYESSEVSKSIKSF